MQDIRFGIVGTGRIAGQFARALAMAKGAHLAAVCSRTMENAERFAREHADACRPGAADEAGFANGASPADGIGAADRIGAANGVGPAAAFTDARAMAASGTVDIVYVATPHPMHFDACMKALEGGAGVLCEKPMVLSRAQALTLFEEADRRGLFAMEAMWSRFLPNSLRAKAWIDGGRIGKVRFIDAMYSCQMGDAPVPRLVRPELGGGALFDIGVYTIEMAAYYAGEDAAEWSGLITPHAPGVDALCAITAHYPGGTLATLRTGIACDAPPQLTVYGSRGRIELPFFAQGLTARLYESGELTESHEEDTRLPGGFVYQIEAVRDALRAGKKTHPVAPPGMTVAAATMMEDVMHRAFPGYY